MDKKILKLIDIKKETPLVDTLVFQSPEVINFIAGQYLNVSLPSIAAYNKPYTISSAPISKNIEFTIKKQGAFSSALLNLKIGDEILVDGPHGYFFTDYSFEKRNVFIAGGIGITPFMSFVRHQIAKKTMQKNLIILYSNKTKKETVFFNELIKLIGQNKIGKLVIFLTQEKARDFENGRINSDAIKKHVKEFQKNNFYICGSIGFVNDMWSMLGLLGIPEEQIFTEAFY